MDEQTRLDDEMANYADMILAGNDPESSEDFVSQVRLMQTLNQVIAPDKSMDAGMRSRLNQRINEEWDTRQHKRRSRFRILNINTYSSLAVAAGIAIVIAIVAIVISMNDPAGSDVAATADGDSNALTVFGVLAGVAVVSGFLYFLWNRRR